ncbi:polysaccharide biosynthesis/export family protein [Aliiroseovarius sp. YM-037]|uniref:polysaccharide biosynthesis/export family protein n=1 Tax=Aliiroseovarius sp. YM-037 TaxID=3341728 RepID=UPI003A7FFA6B
MSSRLASKVAILVIASTVASCGLPRSGPTKNEIFAGSVQNEGNAFVVAVTDHVANATAVTPAYGFSDSFRNAGQLGADTIRPGDTLGLTFWENVQDGILTTEGAPAALEEVQVDSAGMIFVPYAGRIRAADNTPEALRRIITEKLEDQTPDPQVTVRRIAGDGATVSVVGDINGQGVYPIQRPTRTLSGMLAAAGGVNVETEIATITVTRGSHRSKIWLQDLYDNASNDIALRNGDRILVEGDTRTYTVLGATGGQNRVPFVSQTLSALEAVAQVGGLNSNVADPTGMFVLRNEDAAVANAVLGRTDLQGTQRMAYVLDLTEPTGMFMARDFGIRDGDTIYVTEAPFVRWNKTISALTGSLNSVDTLNNLATN